MGSAFHQAPPVVIAAKACGRPVLRAAGVDGRTDLVQRNPSPEKFDSGNVPLLGDAGNSNQLSSRGGDAEGLFLCIAGSDKTLKRIHT